MSQIHLTDNHRDLSTSEGFQFEFYCEGCHDAWRSPFDRYAAGTMEGLLGTAEGLFGGIFGSARRAMEQVGSAGWSRARDGALRKATVAAGSHFHRCPRCGNNHCDRCWNADEGTCTTCVPRLEAEFAAIRTEARIQKAREVAYEKATVSEADLSVRVVSCRECGSAVGKARFCPECGTPASLTRTCGSCSAEVPSSSRFCPECGSRG